MKISCLDFGYFNIVQHDSPLSLMRLRSLALNKPSFGCTSQHSNFHVVLRVRPPILRELSSTSSVYQNTVAIDSNQLQITISDNIDAYLNSIYGSYTNNRSLNKEAVYGYHTYSFDHVFDQISNQEEVYELAIRNIVNSALEGFNSTIFAYGMLLFKFYLSLYIILHMYI